MKENSKYASRKLIVTGVESLLLIAVPLVYHKMGIDQNITLLTITMVGVAAGLYKGANIIEKKMNGKD